MPNKSDKWNAFFQRKKRKIENDESYKLILASLIPYDF